MEASANVSLGLWVLVMPVEGEGGKKRRGSRWDEVALSWGERGVSKAGLLGGGHRDVHRSPP